MTDYTRLTQATQIPRIPLEGHLDLTYRCNNTCRHCWLWLAPNACEQADELSFDEIRRIADEARALGTRKWGISGGEPMLRDDFPAIFDYLTRRETRFLCPAASLRGASQETGFLNYSLNSNSTLITPEIARLLKRKGSKMIALYGATAEVYDAVTRDSGGFEMAMRGVAYLRAAGADFSVQLIPMRANWHQWDKMIELAQSLSPHWRVGAAWLYLSSSGAPATNRAIAAQRLSPRDVIELDKPDPAYGERTEEMTAIGRDVACNVSTNDDDRLFARCIAGRRDFHIDPYGKMTWCSFIKDPALRCDLRRGTFREAWEEFIPSCADKVRGGIEWRANCGACEKRADCRWCAVYAYLETGRYSARVPYLCAVADEARAFNCRHSRFDRESAAGVRRARR